MRRARWTAAWLGAAVALAALPGAGKTAPSAFPGTNGLIAFQSFRDGYAQIYVMTDEPNQPLKAGSQRPSCFALPTWSPNGKQIAFEFNPDRAGRPASNSDVFVMNADGTAPRNLTRRRGFDGDPAWSRDGRSIVFESQRDGNSEIYRVDARTLRVKRLTKNSVPDEDPAWSQDGRIAFTRAVNGNREIYVMNANGSSPRNITRHSASDRNPSWSPRGGLIAFDSDRRGNLDIFKTTVGRQPTQLTTSSGLDALPAWSPDGRNIVFVSDRAEPGNRDLWLMRDDGSSPRKLTQSPAWDVAPDWGTAPRGANGKPPTALPPPPLGDRTSAIACVAR